MNTPQSHLRLLTIFLALATLSLACKTGNESQNQSQAYDEISVKRDAARAAESAPARTEYLYAAPAPQATFGAGDYSATEPQMNREGYAATEENGYQLVQTTPLSTFSIDVDRASYANIRRYLNDNSLPPTGAVRIEEMVNYFAYDYPQPEGQHPFAAHMEMAQAPWNPEHQLVHIGLQGKAIDLSEAPASNLVFLLDVSGSMNSPNKLPLLKQAFELLIGELGAEDRIGIVVYAGAAGVILPPTPGHHKEKILDALESLQAGGSTAGGEGLRRAYQLARDHFIEGGNNRIILATDGDFNVGESSDAAMLELVEQERDAGIFLTVLGFGTGNLQDSKMETIADHGNGNYAYIDNLLEAKKTLVTEMGGTLFTIAKDVKLQVEFNPAKVQAYRLIGYENRLLAAEDFNDDTKDAGELGAGHTVTALYEIVPVGVTVPGRSVDSLRYQQVQPTAAQESGEMLTLKMRYKQPEADESQLLSVALPYKEQLIGEASENMRFASAVAELGLLLRQSEYAGDANYVALIDRAKAAKGTDEEGYRAEFIRLAQTAMLIQNTREEAPQANRE